MILREYLSSNGLTATAFAEQIGVAHTTVLRWADGTVQPSRNAMIRIRDATSGKVMPNDFLSSQDAA